MTSVMMIIPRIKWSVETNFCGTTFIKDMNPSLAKYPLELNDLLVIKNSGRLWLGNLYAGYIIFLYLVLPLYIHNIAVIGQNVLGASLVCEYI